MIDFFSRPSRNGRNKSAELTFNINYGVMKKRDIKEENIEGKKIETD